MKKRFISIILTLSIVMSMFSFSAFADSSVCGNCGNSLFNTGLSLFFGTLDADVYYCFECNKYYGSVETGIGDYNLYEFSSGDQSIIDEYVTSAENGTGGTYETTTDDDGNTTTDYVANDSNTWYVDASGNVSIDLYSYSLKCYYSSTSQQYFSLTNGIYYSNDTKSSSKGFASNYSKSFYYLIDVPFSGTYSMTYTDPYFFNYLYYSSSSSSSYESDSDTFTYSSDTLSGYHMSNASLAGILCLSGGIPGADGYAYERYIIAPVVTLTLEDAATYVSTVYNVDNSSDYTDNSITVNGNAVSGDYIYQVDYGSSDYSSTYSSAYYVYDSSDSGNYTVYNTNSSGDVVSSYYYDNSTGDTITYMTIYESDTFTEEEMYPTDTDGDDDSTSSGSDSSSDSDLSWLTDGLSTIFGAIATVITAILGGIIELLVSLIDELLSSVTYLIDSLFTLLTSVTDFGGEFSGFLTEFFTFLPPEILTLLCLGLSLSIILMIFKFLRD